MQSRETERGSRLMLLRQQTERWRQQNTARKTTIRQKLVKNYLQSNKFAKVFGNGLASLFQKQHLKKQQIFNNKKISGLVESTNSLTYVERLDKGYRHFLDAYYCRDVRHDLELRPNKLISFIYKVQTSILFQDLLYSFSFIFMTLAFWEPANRFDIEYQQESWMKYVELSILIFYLIDLIFHITHLEHDLDKSVKQKFLLNFKFACKLLLTFIFFLDFFIFHTMNQPFGSLRIGRYFRPGLLVVYNKELRRTIKSIFMSFQQILQMILFFFLMNLFWGIIGWQLIGDLDGEVYYDKYIQNFDNLLTSTAILYALSSPDIYPDCMLPAYESSELYLIYFLMFCILFQLLFLPIPVAIVFDAFRKHRAELAMKDKILQHESLLACFVSLDYNDNKRLDFPTFQRFMKRVYLNKKRYFPRIHRLFINLDVSYTKQLSINDFFNIIDQMEADQNLNIPSFGDWKLWIQFRKFMNKYFKLKIIAKSTLIDIVMFVVVIFNTVIVIIAMSSDAPYVYILEVIDDYLLYVYVLEAAIKLTGLGIEKYFEDDWNTFDFTLIVISFLSIISTNLISFFRTLKTVKSTKILKVAKLNRMFRSIKGVRSLKIFNFLLLGAESVVEFKQLISRLMLCTPLILKLIPVVISLFYLYTMIGLEFLDTDNFDYNEDSENNPFDVYHYADFTSFGNAFLIMFQICLGTSWNTIVMDYAFKFQDYLGTVLYFYSFHIISNLIILALVKGIIWEVFTIVEQNTVGEKMKIEAEIEINQEVQEIVKERKQLYDQVMGDLEFSVECLESESSPSQKDLNNLTQTNRGFIFPPQLIPPPTTFQKPQFFKAQTCRRLIGKSNATSQGGIDLSIMSQMKRNSVGSKGQRQTKKRRTIYEKDQADQEQYAKAERIRKRIKQLFITKQELKVVVKDLQTEMKCRREALFDSDDDESMKNYEKQINDNIQSQTKIQYFRRLQESIKNDEHFEKQKSEFQNNQIINQNYVFKRALLKDTNSDKVKKFEVDYFQSNYGQMFDGINQIDLGPLLKYEGFILHNLERAVRHKSTNYNHFVKLLLQIEKNISSIMLCKGSVFKFVFQDNFSNWFYLDDFEDNIVACKTENGPWSYDDEFAHLKMYTALNYFTIEETDELCEELYLQFYNIKTMVDQYNTQFGDFILGQSILDVLLLKYNPTEEESEKITNKSLQLIRKHIATESLPIQVNKFMIFIVMYAGDTKNQGGHLQKQVKLKTLDTLKDQFITEEEKINEYVSLPLNYVIEFMDDIKNLMKISGHKIMMKMNLFLNHSVKLKNQQKVEKVT